MKLTHDNFQFVYHLFKSMKVGEFVVFKQCLKASLVCWERKIGVKAHNALWPEDLYILHHRWEEW